MIIFSPNAIVEILAMMIKLFRATVAFPAMMTLMMNLRITISAEKYLVLFIFPFYFEEKIIHWVGTGQIAIIKTDK